VEGSIPIHRLIYQQRESLTLERASEDELKLASTETPDFWVDVDLCPNHSQFDQSTGLRSTALHCDWIFWNDAGVGIAQELIAYVCIHLGWVRDWIIDPASFVLERTTTQLRDILHGKFPSIETFIETWLARAIEISSRRVGSHVCQPSLLTIPIIPYSLPKISTSKNPYTDTRDAELGTIPDAGALPMGCGVVSGVPCSWGCWLMHRCRGMNALRISVSSVILLI